MEKNESPDGDIHVYSERNCPLGHFPCLGKLSLSLISVQKDCLISLRSIRHHSFFSTIAESESSSHGMKSSSSFAFSPWTHVCHHGGTIIPWSKLLVKLTQFSSLTLEKSNFIKERSIKIYFSNSAKKESTKSNHDLSGLFQTI